MDRYLKPVFCPLWHTLATEIPREHQYITVYSSRCGGLYSISREVLTILEEDDDLRKKALLTSWLIEQRRLGNECPEITESIIKLMKQRKDMSASDRADAILEYIASKIKESGEALIYDSNDSIKEHEEFLFRAEAQLSFQELMSEWKINYCELLAFSECTDNYESNNNGLASLMKYLKQHNWIEYEYDQYNSGHRTCSLTVEGYTRLAEIQKIRKDSSRGFMAMWFDPSMDKAWQEGFEPGIRKAGYDPVRIDQQQHVNKIDDEIIAEIRKARFIVADFTQDERGARGGVYYEAGFAHGLGIPVIFTCRKDCLKEIHFDIRQYNCILWEDKDLEKLQKDLTNRIRAILRDGPAI